MNRLLIILFILLSAIWLGIQIHLDPGYLLISYQKWTLEMPLWLAGFILLLLICAISFIVHFFKSGHQIMSRSHAWWQKHNMNRLESRSWQTYLDAENHFATGFYEEARETLLPLMIKLENPAILNLLTKIAIKLKDHDGLLQLKTKLCTPLIEITLTKWDLSRCANDHGLAALQKHWHRIASKLRKDPFLIAHYAKALAKLKANEDAIKLLQTSLRHKYDATLIDAYGLIIGNFPEKQLRFAEKFLKAHPHDADLGLCLGRLCKQLQFWGKAKDYLEHAIALNHNPAAYLELSHVLEQVSTPNQNLDPVDKSSSHQDLSHVVRLLQGAVVAEKPVP